MLHLDPRWELFMTIERKTITSREEWLEWRKPDITASTIGALFNCHPYTTALKLYAEKRGTEFPFEDNAAMRRGRWLEPAVAKAVQELRPEWQIEAAHEYIRDPYLRLGCTPDFYLSTTSSLGVVRGILQTKTVAPSVYARDWADGVEVPLWIILQASIEAMLTEADFIVIAALLVDPHHMDVAIHEMPRNPIAEQKIKDAVAQFWHDVDNGIEPQPDFERDADVLKAMWRRESEPPIEIDLSGDNRIPELLKERASLKSAEKMAHDRIESINTQLIYALKDAAVAVGIPGWRITYKTTHYKAYTVAERDARVLRITEQK
jgi:predicted phage-related endonuclease